jgi:hypothetical protein
MPNASIANWNCRIHTVFRHANTIGRAERHVIEAILFACTLMTIGLLLFDMFSSCWTRELGMSVDGAPPQANEECSSPAPHTLESCKRCPLSGRVIVRKRVQLTNGRGFVALGDMAELPQSRRMSKNGRGADQRSQEW